MRELDAKITILIVKKRKKTSQYTYIGYIYILLNSFCLEFARACLDRLVRDAIDRFINQTIL